MTKYQKKASPSRKKRKLFEVVEPTAADCPSYVDDLARAHVQSGLQRALEAGEALFTYFHFPQRHWVHQMTTNPIESLFATARLRTAAARRMRTRTGALCLIFQLLKHSEQRLRRIRAYTIVANTIDELRFINLKRRKAA